MIDPARLAAAFEAHGAALALYARQWLDRATAEDVVQEVFVRLMAQGAEPANLPAWLFRCVRNAAIAAARSGQRRRRREAVAGVPGGSWFDPRPDDRIDAAAAQAALAHLPPTQREVIILRLWSGMTLAEVTEVTGLAVSTAHDQYRAGLVAVRRVLERERSVEPVGPSGST